MSILKPSKKPGKPLGGNRIKIKMCLLVLFLTQTRIYSKLESAKVVIWQSGDSAKLLCFIILLPFLSIRKLSEYLGRKGEVGMEKKGRIK